MYSRFSFAFRAGVDRRTLLALGLAGLVAAAHQWGFHPSAPAEARAEPAWAASPAPSALDQAKRLIEAGEPEAAATLLRRFLSAGPKPQYLDDAYLLLGAAFYGMKEYGEALKQLSQLQQEFPSSDLLDRAKLLAARNHAAMGNLDLALPILAEVRSLSSDDRTKREALKLIGELHLQKKDYVRAIQAWIDEMQGATEEQATDVRERIRGLIEEKLDKKALLRLRAAYPRSFPGDVAAIRLIDLHLARGEDHLAERQINQFLASFPAHPYASKAIGLLEGLRTKLRAHEFIVAAVLPLTGKLSPYANDVLDGIQLAVERVRDQPGAPSVGLVVKDTEADRASFLTDFTDLLEDYRPLAVIGPLLSKNLPAIAEMAERARVPVITPSATLPNVRRLGTYLFSTALTHHLQAKRIAAYAVGEQGYRRFCILHPDTTYGRELARLFTQEVHRRDGEIIAVESYKEGDTDFGPQLKRMKAEDLKTYGLAVPIDPAKQNGKVPNGRSLKADKRVLYTPGFDAIFIPGRSSEIGLIAAQLAFHDMTVPLLGANGWNAPDFARTADRHVDGAVFVDGFFVDSPSPNVQDFVARYQRRYQTLPSLFAVQGYDAARLALEAVTKGATTGEAVRDYLLLQHDLPTVGGPAGFSPEGTLNRPLFLIQVKQGRFVQVD